MYSLSEPSQLTDRHSPVFLTYRILHQLIIYPYLFSPIRKIPGPPLGSDGFPSSIQSSQSESRSWLARKLWSLLAGHFPAIIRGEAGVLQREWVKQYGPVVRAVGPMGIERLIFTSHEALHKILQESVDHPRVSECALSFIFRSFASEYMMLTCVSFSLTSCATSLGLWQAMVF